MQQFPFTAIVASDDMALALQLTAISPSIGGVLVRGEKGTAKSTMVRALAHVLPDVTVVDGCRFGCAPNDPDPGCPDGPHVDGDRASSIPARLVELPVGATEDRVTGSLDVSKALAKGEAAFAPGLLAAAHRGILYVDEVNLLHDHLVDLLLDAAAMGRNSVERDGVSASHAAKIVLVGTMNPEEGELRPQLLDRFGLTVEVSASRDVTQRTEVIRRRLAFDADPEGFAKRYEAAEAALRERITSARERVEIVVLSEWALTKISTVCAGFEVDGLRADIVTARAAMAHAALQGRTHITREDVRQAAILALPHRRRRNPFDAPGLDLDLLDQLLGDDEPPEEPDPTDPKPTEPDDHPQGSDQPNDSPERGSDAPPADSSDAPQPGEPPTPGEAQPSEDHSDHQGQASSGVAQANRPYQPKSLRVKGVGTGAPGRRSKAITNWGRTVGSSLQPGPVHLVATINAAARHRQSGPVLRVTKDDLRSAIRQGKEANLIVFAVDASGSMAARKRMGEVKTAILSLLMDAYQRRDRVALVTFRGLGASIVLPPTRSVDAAAACLSDLEHGGRTPLAQGLRETAHLLDVERTRDPKQRPLVVLITDGRATAGRDALTSAQAIGSAWPGLGVDTVVIDCESGRFRLGLAADLAGRMRADYVPLADLRASAIVDVVSKATTAKVAA